MVIPTYEEVMLPLLEIIKAKNEYSLKDTIKLVSKNIGLTEEEENRVLPIHLFDIKHTIKSQSSKIFMLK